MFKKGIFTPVAGVVAFVAFIAFGLGCPMAQAETLPEALEGLLQKHKLLQAAENDLKAAGEQVGVAWGGWYPKLDVTAHKGYEVTQKGQGATDTHLPSQKLDLSVTQRLYDFGTNNAVIDKAELGRLRSQSNLIFTRQNLLLEGVTAYLEIMRTARTVKFAESSEVNVKRQTELEDARVLSGSGFSTDVLQAKTQLAGAQARLVRASGALRQAQNRYKAVFYTDAINPDALVQPRTPLDMIPTSLDDAIEIALNSNPKLRLDQLTAEISRQEISRTKAQGFYPTLDAVGQSIYKRDDGGTVGGEIDKIVKLQLNYNFNLGMTAINSLRAAESTQSADEQRYAGTRNQIVEQVRNAWNDLETAQANAELLRNQANIAAEFLELARRERQLGRRSLIDVLAGETALINANSDAASAETDVAISVFKILAATGKLELQIIQ